MSKPYRDSSDGVGLDVRVTLPAPICEKSREAAKECGETFSGWRRAELIAAVEVDCAAEVPPEELAFDVRQALLKAPATKRLDDLAVRTLTERIAKHLAQARLDLAPPGWRDGPGALRWRPGAHLSTPRTRTRVPAWLDVRQSDRGGVLSFTSRARVQALPWTVHAFGASLTAKRSDRLRFRAGYAGMMVDGEPVHGAVAGLSMRF